jgi:UDP-N-acetylglucosamine diphosphorylase / glucose-1-phosphate thymidylyltransferase / UDP-N-acetylgalactosamine diphosphorylase / glucosamine-1-phosphate N-acetyltransferase / galactosamine-1-phosphate N-acetyltransferase
MSVRLSGYVDVAAIAGLTGDEAPWAVCHGIARLIEDMLGGLGGDYRIADGIAIHASAAIEAPVTIKPPAIVGSGCLVAAGSYLRGGVIIAERSVIGPSVEIKSSLILPDTIIAHLNFVGDSVIGRGVNLEAGAVIANHHNDRIEKGITVTVDGARIATGVEKFGALIGDFCRIGANAVLSPGTILPRRTIVPRLALVDQGRH